MLRKKWEAIELIGEANAAGASLVSACYEIGISLRTLKRWWRAFLCDGDGEARRKGSPRLGSHRLSDEERQRILLTCNQSEYASLPPGQIVPALADKGLYIGSESSYYCVLHQAGQCQRIRSTRCCFARSNNGPTIPRNHSSAMRIRCTFVATFIAIAITTVWGAGSSLNSRSSEQ
jgi:hypothetical protein